MSDISRRLDASPYELMSEYKPCGDQPQAIEKLVKGLAKGLPFQTLMGVTGSGKTFTIANVLSRVNRPALVMAPNKTLAAQLYSELKEFFPRNKVRYFVSFYDYYQPEAYVPSTDTYIEKDSAINDEIDKMRHSATKALLEARDTIIVASVSCIYGLGAPDEYFKMMLYVEKNQKIAREEIIRKLVQIRYTRKDVEFVRGSFRVRGEVIDIFPSDQDAQAVRLVFFGDEIEEIRIIDPVTGKSLAKANKACIYPTSHFLTSEELLQRARKTIRAELQQVIPEMKNRGKILEAQRLEQRTLYDLELIDEIGFCPGIENYSRHLTGREPGSPPPTLLDYFPKDFVLVLDESHVTVPQIGGMFRGDRARKQTLVDFGFRLPSALDNRPLNFDDFWQRVAQAIFVSATPAQFEFEKSAPYVVEQIIRPTGLLDPEVFIRPASHQVDNLLAEIPKVVQDNEKVLVLTLTKKMAEDLTDYLRELGIRVKYLHSDIDTIERFEILRALKNDEFDVLVGINLLREGLDLPVVSLVAILDGDKEGFLRSKTSLIQIMGRAARNERGRVIVYADKMTESIKAAVTETDRRRKIQIEYNQKHGIVPKTIIKKAFGALGNAIEDVLGLEEQLGIELPKDRSGQQKLLETLRREMFELAARKEFEQAAKIRDRLNLIQEKILKL